MHIVTLLRVSVRLIVSVCLGSRENKTQDLAAFAFWDGKR